MEPEENSEQAFSSRGYAFARRRQGGVRAVLKDIVIAGALMVIAAGA
jgi:hypothetical protein